MKKGDRVIHNGREDLVFEVDDDDFDYPDRVWVKDPRGGYSNFRRSELKEV